MSGRKPASLRVRRRRTKRSRFFARCESAFGGKSEIASRFANARGRNDGRGIVLLGALIILLTISLIGATLASFFFSVNTVAEVELNRAQALYLAEAGVADVIYQLRQGGLAGDTEQNIASKALGDGDYQVIHDPAAGLITSTGRVHGVRRTIQVKYLPF